MKTPNAKNLRFILIGCYLFCVLAFCALAAVFAWRHAERRTRAGQTGAERCFAVALCREALDNAARPSALAAADPTPSNLDAVWRRIADLRRASAALAESFPRHKTAADLLRNVMRAQMFTLSCRARLADLSDPAAAAEYREDARALFDTLAASASDLRILEDETAASLRAAAAPDDAFYPRIAGVLAAFFIAAAILLLGIQTLLDRIRRKALHSLSFGARELSGGNLEYRFREITPDEIGQVKYDFNMMARRIERQDAELRKANGELREQAEKLIQAHQHKDRFLSNMSHELRTPLNSIIGFSELLEARAGHLPEDKEKSYAQRILTAAGHLLSLITALLDLAKSGAGTLKAVPVDFDLSFAVREMCDMLSPLAAKKKLEMRTAIEPDLHLTADPRMIRQIFINLFGNAVKYTFSGSVEVTLANTASNCLLSVRDTGIGIAEADQKNLFRDFYRVESAEKMAVDGVGIGLALSRRLAALNHASIRFVSAAGKGSTFTLVLPRATLFNQA